MTFVEMMKLKLHFAFANRALTYVSTEGEQAVQKLRQEETQGRQKKKNKAGSRKSMGKTETDREGFDKARKKMFRMLTAMVLFFVLFVALAVWYKYR